MDSGFLRLLILIALSFLTQQSNAQSSNIDSIINNLVNIKLEKVNTNTKETIIVANDKNCLRCFKDVCNYLTKTEKSEDIKLLIITEKDYLKILPKVNYFKNATPCVKEVLIYFIGEDEFSIYNEPSPQLILKRGDNIDYIQYGQLMELIKK